MDIESIKKIIFPAVNDVIVKLEEDNHEVKLTMLREIFNEAINSPLQSMPCFLVEEEHGQKLKFQMTILYGLALFIR